jgi:hypothetical protein
MTDVSTLSDFISRSAFSSQPMSHPISETRRPEAIFLLFAVFTLCAIPLSGESILRCHCNHFGHENCIVTNGTRTIACPTNACYVGYLADGSGLQQDCILRVMCNHDEIHCCYEDLCNTEDILPTTETILGEFRGATSLY